jgi:hypothetical protein
MANMNIVNLTPHTINIYDENHTEILAVPPSGNIAKISVNREKVASVRMPMGSNIPIFETTSGEPEGLPEEKLDTILIVSGMFRAHVNRSDLYQPGELLRDENGQPIGCVGLSR